MDPALPVARSLAIAGELVAGGVSTHETSLPGPERIYRGGRCVVPGITDSHVHFPTWAIAQHEVRLEGTRSVEEAVARVREARDRPRKRSRSHSPRSTRRREPGSVAASGAAAHRRRRARRRGTTSTRSRPTGLLRYRPETYTPSPSTPPRSRARTATSRSGA